MTAAAQQNALMLAALLGIDEAAASARLQRTVLVTAEPGPKTAWAREIGALVGRTLEVAYTPVGPAPHRELSGLGLPGLVLAGFEEPDLELIVGEAVPVTQAKRLYADLGASGAVVAEKRSPRLAGTAHSFHAAAAACAAAAAAVHAAIGDAALPPVRLPMRFDYAQLGIPAGALDRPIVLSDAAMAGAGAVAHGFLRAARHLELRGALAVVDPKTVQSGILNRCLYLQTEDIGGGKAAVLTARAQRDFPGLRLTPHVADLKAYTRELGHPPDTVFVTVDSRNARRSIQLEVPRRIVDASTTDARGVIVHSNVLPTDHACLACIYRHVPEEHARERSIAEGLGVELADVRGGLITAEVAQRITRAHPAIDPAAITGMAFDSLFRQLCSQQALATPEGRQVLAPFAFVSAWAGILMAAEMLRVFTGVTDTNYWSVDPWNLPLARGRTLRPRHPDCQFCGRAEYEPIVRELWG